jgi:hypothetical protein
MIACLRRRHSDPVKLIDAAYWVKGCSSLGRLRYALLVRVGHRRNAGLYLIDAKEAVKSAAPGVADKSMPKDNSLRVIAGAKALAPYLGDRMAAGRVGEAGLVLRELTPHDLKIEVSRLPSKEPLPSLPTWARSSDSPMGGRWTNKPAPPGAMSSPSFAKTPVMRPPGFGLPSSIFSQSTRPPTSPIVASSVSRTGHGHHELTPLISHSREFFPGLTGNRRGTI